jgi:hypothetical protein
MSHSFHGERIPMGTPMEERRATVRQKVFKAGTIEFNRAGAIGCTVRNVSLGGACLEFDSLLGVPETFALVLRADRTMRHCKVRWRNARRVGVAFE